MRSFIDPRTGKPVDYDELRSNPERREAILGLAYSAHDRRVECACKLTNRAKIGVFESKALRHFLRCLPKCRADHAPDCDFWDSVLEAASTFFEREAVEETSEGVLRVGLSGGLGAVNDGPEVVRHPVRVLTHQRQARRSPSVRLLGLLQLLWHRSGLHVYDPRTERRGYIFVANILTSALESIVVSGAPAADVIFIPTVPKATKGADYFGYVRATFETWRNIRLPRDAPCRIIIGEFHSADEQHTSVALRLKLFPEPIALSLRRWQASVNSFGIPVSCDRGSVMDAVPPEKTTRTWCILKCRGGDNGIECDAAAWMSCSRDNVTVDSSYEVKVADALIRKGWRFEKPIRYEGQELFSDFNVLQGQSPYPMEVWGMENLPEYRERKAEKLVKYGERVWSWTDPEHAAMPGFEQIEAELAKSRLFGSAHVQASNSA